MLISFYYIIRLIVEQSKKNESVHMQTFKTSYEIVENKFSGTNNWKTLENIISSANRCAIRGNDR